MVPTFDGNGQPVEQSIARGRLTSVWLGGLVNPQALLMAMQQEKAVLVNKSVEEVSWPVAGHWFNIHCSLGDKTWMELDSYEVGVGGGRFSTLHASVDTTTKIVCLLKTDTDISQFAVLLTLVVQSKRTVPINCNILKRKVVKAESNCTTMKLSTYQPSGLPVFIGPG